MQAATGKCDMVPSRRTNIRIPPLEVLTVVSHREQAELWLPGTPRRGTWGNTKAR